MIFYTLTFVLIVLIDQFTKIYVSANDVHFVLIDNFFGIKNSGISIDYITNSGASFSMLADVSWAQTFFKIITIVFMLTIILYLTFVNNKNVLHNLSWTFILGGTVGNFIDRLLFNEVTDFIYVHWFANFNVADSFLCVGVAMLVVYILFFDKPKQKTLEKDNATKD